MKSCNSRPSHLKLEHKNFRSKFDAVIVTPPNSCYRVKCIAIIGRIRHFKLVTDFELLGIFILKPLSKETMIVLFWISFSLKLNTC